jgi:hypothetical protein
MYAIIANVLPEYVLTIDPKAAIATAKNANANEIVIISEDATIGIKLGLAGIRWREI